MALTTARFTRWGAGLALSGLLAAACGSDDDQVADTSSDETAATAGAEPADAQADPGLVTACDAWFARRSFLQGGELLAGIATVLWPRQQQPSAYLGGAP
jgi:hypothetical protein